MFRTPFASLLFALAWLVVPPASAQDAAQSTAPDAAEANIGDGDGTVSVRVPVTLPYGLLEAAIKQQLKPISAPGGLVIKADDVALSGRGGRLYADAKAGVSGKVDIGLLKIDVSTDGTLQLSGVPHVGPDGKSLSLKQVKATAKLADPTLSALVEAAMPVVAGALSTALTVDLNPQLTTLREVFDARFSNVTAAPGVSLSFSDLDLSIASLTAEDAGLRADVAVDMGLKVNVNLPQ